MKLPIVYANRGNQTRASLALTNGTAIFGPWASTRAETTRGLGDFCQWFADDGHGPFWAAVARALWAAADDVSGPRGVA